MPISSIEVFEYNGTLLGTNLIGDEPNILLGSFSGPVTGDLADNDGTLESNDDGISTFDGQPLTYIGSGLATPGLVVGGALVPLGASKELIVFESMGQIYFHYPNGTPGLVGAVALGIQITPVGAEVFENPYVGTDIDDNFVGDDFDNVMEGAGGNDTLNGGAGGDQLDGGTGSDTADYSDSAGFVNVSLATGFAGGGAGSHAVGDTFISIENLTGSAHDDILSGDGGANVLKGGDGNDLLRGRGGADVLDGGTGSDTATYDGSAGFVNVSLLTGYAGGGAGSHATGDTFISIENLTGSAHDDILSGDHGANVLKGGDGNDLLRGRGGADVLDGGDGIDTATYDDSAAWVNVSLLTGYAGGGAGSHATGDTFISIENVTGSAHDDLLSGDHGANVLKGGDGNDLLRGRDGADVLEGGAGIDTATYDDSAAWVNVSLLTGFAGGGALSHAIGDTLSSIENLTGSAYDDRLSGDDGANVLKGGDGADTLNGHDGDDVLEGGAGADVLQGGEGSDTASYENSSSWVNVSLLTGFTGGGGQSQAIGDTFSSIENLRGSAFDDILNGDDNANVLSGGDGADILRGRGGADVLEGGAGADSFVFNIGFGDDRVVDFENGVDVLDFSENAQITAISDLTITDSGADALVTDSFGNSVTVDNMAGLLTEADFVF
ncbi:calcium-binding protein [Ponticoccus alexandrii]|uniref:Calcium-binding protein n=1 Tax=Ponticoccus alexandrii TaxID=1943633 RepID=A0ABX7F908_9RHOB|nr:calcium-binding protein [Ponticoccus alexandrii]QRF66173.1 hypothetical protein GQA70_07570 [Ponticoccus alexandrii]